MKRINEHELADFSNSNSGNYADYVNQGENKKILVAFCTSYKCCAQPENERVVARVIKEVRKSTMDCPDCKAALLWKQVSKAVKLS